MLCLVRLGISDDNDAANGLQMLYAAYIGQWFVLKAEAAGLDFQFVHSKLWEFGLVKTNNLFVSLAEKVCGLDFSDLLFERLLEAECSTVLEYILTGKRRVISKHSVPRFVYKLKTLAGNNWKFATSPLQCENGCGTLSSGIRVGRRGYSAKKLFDPRRELSQFIGELGITNRSHHSRNR